MMSRRHVERQMRNDICRIRLCMGKEMQDVMPSSVSCRLCAKRNSPRMNRKELHCCRTVIIPNGQDGEEDSPYQSVVGPKISVNYTDQRSLQYYHEMFHSFWRPYLESLRLRMVCAPGDIRRANIDIFIVTVEKS